jgi:hyperosmotically inducible periplasmic protein
MKRTLLTLASLGALCLTTLARDDKTSPVDNTAQNERDRSGETRTSGDQSNSPQDLKITTDIRQAIMKDNGLSMTAKNIKIITAGAQVTLRGPVNTAEEKAKIEQLAQSAAGNAKIDNQLEVKASEQGN